MLFLRNQSAVLAGNEHSKIVAIDVKSDIKVGGMQMGLGWIVEGGDLWPCQDDVARSRWAAKSAL
ncbi:hypothetical protein SAMN05216330_110151 [Bradyrhizobium sp. Ghvi]|nr:hypothetical protein SAMN05216330_110151 [Bradyrhizobium sp. Ghvi]